MCETTLPQAVRPMYPPRAIGEPLLLYEGTLTALIRQDDDEIQVPGDGWITFEFLPWPAVTWYFCARGDSSGVAEWWEPTLEPTLDASMMVVSDVNFSDNSISDSQSDLPEQNQAAPSSRLPRAWFRSVLHPVEIGDGGSLTAVHFQLINMPEEDGNSWIDNGQGFAALHRIALQADGWHIEIDATRSHGRIMDHIRNQQSYAFTHSCRLYRETQGSFAFEDAVPLLDGLQLFLSFVRGGDVGVALPVGLNEQGTPQFLRWSCTVVDPGGELSTWYPGLKPEVFEPLYSGFMRKWNDSYWNEVMRSLIGYYLAANDTVLERGLLAACTALEQLSWAVLVESERWLVQDGFDRITLGDRIRLLLKWAGIPACIPSSLEHLRCDEVKYQLVDGPGALAWVRNRVVHPDKKKQLSNLHKYEAWDLSKWYLDLLLLNLFEYSGNYANRLQQPRWRGNAEPVPWANDATAPKTEG